MLHKSITIGLISTAFVVTLMVSFAESFSPSHLSEPGVQKPQRRTESRNMELQPEAVKLSRRIGGRRFNSEVTPALIMQGELTVGSERQQIQISRRPGPKGENVEVALVNKSTKLTWNETSETLSPSSKLNNAERKMLERLVFDSADQFILAQLRGANYYVVARNVRPDDASDDYSGPLWDVVRIDDPESDKQGRWRLYYLNHNTGLIDKIVSEYQGEQIEATLSNWTKQADEMVPLAITWTSGGQTVMTLTLTNVSLDAQ